MTILVLIGLLFAILFFCACRESTVEAAAQTAAPATGEPIAAPTPEPIAAPTPEPTEVPTPEPTEVPTPEPTAEPAPTPFSIVWMSDTQNLSQNYREVFYCMRDWILENRETRNIVFAVHSGDVVDGANEAQWNAAAEALMPIFEQIPGMIASGNHDVGKDLNYVLFSNRPYAKAVQKEGQTYNDGQAAYTTFEAGGDEFLVFGIGFAVRGDAVRRWITEVSEQHPDAIVLYVMHYALRQGGMHSGHGREFMLSVIGENPNARMMLCGHNDGAARRTDWFDDDGDGAAERSFTTMMFNYQDDEKDGLGFLRILTFYPEDRRIEVETYSPWLDRTGHCKTEPDQDHFVLENAY